MSFLRQKQIYPPMGPFVDTGDGPLSGFAPGPIVWMSLQPAIPWQVALPQSLPPLRRVRLFCYKESGCSTDFQRTANSGLTGCRSEGVHFRNSLVYSLAGRLAKGVVAAERHFGHDFSRFAS